MKFLEEVELHSNIRIVARERGKLVTTREGKNIVCNAGKTWVSQLICCVSYDPWVPETNARMRYVGFGIGGTRQLALSVVNDASNPQKLYYSGTNVQTDTDPTVTKLERPVRYSGGRGGPEVGDVWLGQLTGVTPSDHPTPRATTFNHVVLADQISYAPFSSVQLSEVALYTSDADPSVRDSVCVAYDTFDTISKTSAIDLEIAWTWRIG